jgi:Fe2+ transport system protein FeoA
MQLSAFKNGEAFRVTQVVLAKEVGKKLADMGFTSGAEGRIVRSALFGGPIQVRILGYHVSIRKVEADGIVAEPLYPIATHSASLVTP